MNPFFAVALGWLLVLVVFLGFLSLLRYLDHRERMAMILRGITPPDKRRARLPKPRLARSTGVLQGGLITAMVGLALTLGLYPLGYVVPSSLIAPYHLGPWLLVGLIPLAVGIALILGHYLTPGRPIELPPGAPAKTPDEPSGNRNPADPSGALDQPAPGPLALPEPGRWTLYRRALPGSAQPLPEDDTAEEASESG